MLFVFLVVLQLFLIIGLGYAAGFLKFLNKGASDILSNYVYYFSIPALLFIYTSQMSFKEIFDLKAAAVYSVAIIFTALTTVLVCKLQKIDFKTCSICMLGILMGNIVAMGLPFNVNTQGGNAAAVTMSVITLTIILANVLGIVIGQGMIYSAFNGENGHGVFSLIKIIAAKIFSDTIILAMIIGGLVALFNFKIPDFIKLPLRALGDTTSPVSLFALGLFFAEKPLRSIKIRPVFGLATVKLLAFPIFVFILLKFFPIDPIKAGVLISQAGMPVAILSFVFAKKWGVAEDFAGSLIFVSTVASILTLPLLTTLLF